MSDWKEDATSVIKIATDILFVRNPVGTSMGVFFGIILHGIAGIFSPFLQTISVIKISAINIIHYVAIGIFGFNIKNLITQHKISPEAEEAIKFIELQKDKGNITELEAKLRNREIISTVINNVQLDKKTKQAVSAIKGLED